MASSSYREAQDGRLILHALAALESEQAPLLRRRQPYWRPRPPACWEQVMMPRYDWAPRRHREVVWVDVNGSYLAPLSGTNLAHGQLTHTRDAPFTYLPGYYLIEVPVWEDTRMPHPLGTAQYGRRVWVTAPVVSLLVDLWEEGYVQEPAILDSWTCGEKCRPTAWAAWLRDHRAAALTAKDEETYEAVKYGYSMAMEMMITGKQSKTHRPDWGHTIISQHAINSWRKGWKAAQLELGPVALGHRDELAFLPEDWEELKERARTYDDPKMVPLKIDESAYQLGAFKEKERDSIPSRKERQ